MKHQEPGLNIFIRYFSKKSSVKENAVLEQWIKDSPENGRKFNELKQIWDSSDNYIEFEKKWFDADKDWEKLNNTITHASNLSDKKKRKESSNYISPHPSSVHMWMRIAAIFLFVALMGAFAYQNWSPVETSEQQPVLREITTELGQRVNLNLSDGTKVVLNADSKIKLPRFFDADKREVYLEGQAYFKVAKNPDKPFIIHSGNTETRVLGTVFSISAYPSDEQVTVAVEEGRVSFEAADALNTSKTILNRYQVASYDKDNRNLKTKEIDDLQLYLGWVDGYLKFREAPMKKVATELERRYGIEVRFENEKIKEKSLTALLKSRSLQNVLDVISMSLKIRYRIEENTVFFMN